MKRNLSSQAIRAMAIGMAVTMGATTALSGVTGNVAVVKADVVTRDYVADAVKNGATKPALSSNKYIEVPVGDVFLMFEVTADDTENNGDTTSSGKVKLLEIKSATQITAESDLNGTDKEHAYIGTIGGSADDLIKVTYSTSSAHVAFKLDQIGDSSAPLSDAPVTVDGTELSKISKHAVTVQENAFKNITVNGDLDLSAATTITNAFKGTGVDEGNKGVTVTGELKLKSDADVTGQLEYTNIGTLNLTNNSASNTATFTNVVIGTLTLPATYTGVANNFDNSTFTTLDLSAVTDALASNTFAGATIDELRLNANFTGAANTFKATTISGDLDLSTVDNINAEAFKGTGTGVSDKGITVTGTLKLKENFTSSDAFAYTDINTLDLSNNTDALASLTFANATIGTFKAPTDGTYTGAENVFQNATITNVDLSAVEGTLNPGILNNATITGTLILPTASGKLDAVTGTSTNIKNLVHNGITTMGTSTITGDVTFTGNANINANAFQNTKFEAGSKITIANANQVQSGSTNAFDFADGSKTNIEFTAYETGKEADIKTACGDGVTGEGKVNIILPAGKEAEVVTLNQTLSAETAVQNVKAYVNNVVAGIDNPSSVELTAGKYILTANGELFKVVRPKETGDLPTAEAAYIGTVEAAGVGGEANGTNIPYVATLEEDTLSIAPSSGDAVACKVNQIGDGTNALSSYILGTTPTKGEPMTTVDLNIAYGKSVEIANKAFEGITNITVNDTAGVTAIGNEAFKGATITSGKFNTSNVISFGERAFEDATLTEAQEIVVNEAAMGTLTAATSAFKFTSAAEGTKIKLETYTKTNKEAVVGAFTGASELTNVTVEIPYSLDAETLKTELQEALTSATTGVNVAVATKPNDGVVAPKQGDIIVDTTTGAIFEVLPEQAVEIATTGTVKLVSLGNQQVQSRAGLIFDGTFADGVVTVTYNSNKTATFNVTQIGNGEKAITTRELTAETLASYMTNATKIADKALENVILTGNLEIPSSVASIGANALNLQSSTSVIKFTEYGSTITEDMLDNAVGETTAQIIIELPSTVTDEQVASLVKLIPQQIKVRTSLGDNAVGTTVKASNDKGTYTFEIIEQAEDDVESDKANKVSLVAFEGKSTRSKRSVDAMISGNRVIINEEQYYLTQLGDGKNPISGITSEALEGMTTNVETVSANAFKGNKDVTTIDLTMVGTIESNAFDGSGITSINLPYATTIGDSAFAGTTALTEVKLPEVTTIGSSAFENTSIQSISAPKATEVGANAFANNEKLTLVNVGTEVDSQIKMDSTALSGSSNITVVNTNTASKDQVTEAIKQSGTKNNVTVSAGGTTETVKPEETKKPSNSISGGGANIGTSNNTSNTTTQTTTSTETTTETTTESTTQIEDKTLSLDVISLPSVEGTAVSFSDVSESSWAKPYIDKLSTAGIINGSNGKFNPNGQTKRADVTVMLVKLLGLTPETNNKFADVDASAYYAPYVGTASSYGIVNGSNGMFKPESVISRQDTMVMISQILKGLNLNVNTDTSVLDQFSDVNNISGYAQESVAILVNSGIVSGSNGKLNPTNPVTRAEMATIMSKLYDVISSASN